MPVDITALQLNTVPDEDDEEGDDELHEELTAGHCALQAKQYDQAAEHFGAALEIAEAALGADHHVCLGVHLSIARTHRARGQLERVTELLDNARECAMGVLDKNKLPGQEMAIYAQISRVLNMAALNLMTLGSRDQLREAEEFMEQAVNMTQLINGDAHKDMLGYLNHCELCIENLHRLFPLQGKTTSTEPLFRLMQEYHKEAQMLHSAYPTVEELADALVEFCNKQDKLEGFVPVLLDVLETTRDSLGAKHELVSQRLLAVAKLYRTMGRLDRAEAVCVEALEIKRLWGMVDSVPSLGVSLAQAELALVYQQQHKLADAEALFEAALAVAEQNNALHDKKNEGNRGTSAAQLAVAERCCALGLFYRSLGQLKMRPQPVKVLTEPRVEIVDLYSRAQPLLERALSIFTKELGEDHIRVAFALSAVAVCYQLQGRADKGVEMSETAHAIIHEKHVVIELQLLRALMAEGQGIVQQQLDDLKTKCKECTKGLAACKKEVRRQAHRSAKLKAKCEAEFAALTAEKRSWENDLRVIEGWGQTSMRLKMKRADAMRRVEAEFELVQERHKAHIKDRRHLLKQKAKLIQEQNELHAQHEATIRTTRKEIDKLSSLLGERYKSVLAKAFKIFDRDGSGTLDKVELRKVLEAVEPEMPEEKRARLIAVADKDGDGEVDYEEFVLVLMRREVNFDELRKAFKEADSDGSGSLDHDELRALMLKVEPAMSLEEVEEYVKGADADGDGDIDYKEFIFFMKSMPWRRAFKEADQDGSGVLDVAELTAVLFELNPEMSSAELDELVEACDRDGGGTVDYEEFLRFMQDREEVQEF